MIKKSKISTYDVAMITLKKAFTLGPKIMPICLVKHNPRKWNESSKLEIPSEFKNTEIRKILLTISFLKVTKK